MPEGGAESLVHAFEALELATLSLDGITHSLGEARLLARIASRPEGAAQRGLIAARYAHIRGDIEQRSSAAALENADRVMVLLGSEDGRQGSLITRSLPGSRFESPDEAKAVVRAMDFALKAVDDEAACLREAAGHLADRLAQEVRISRAAPAHAPAKPAAAPVATPKAARAAGRRAA